MCSGKVEATLTTLRNQGFCYFERREYRNLKSPYNNEAENERFEETNRLYIHNQKTVRFSTTGRITINIGTRRGATEDTTVRKQDTYNNRIK